jgi:hypothetical protein
VRVHTTLLDATPIAYAAGGQGPPGPRRPRPGACASWNPDLMLTYAKHRACMPAGRSKPKDTNLCLGIMEACAGAAIVRQAACAGGLGARCASSGEREGRRRLASMIIA